LLKDLAARARRRTLAETLRKGEGKGVNRTIRDFAADPRIPDDAAWEFFCECGCFTLVSLTIAEFDGAAAICAEDHEERLLSA
jgi:hypothetical protein